MTDHRNNETRVMSAEPPSRDLQAILDQIDDEYARQRQAVLEACGECSHVELHAWNGTVISRFWDVCPDHLEVVEA